MRLLSWSKLRDFVESRTGDAETALRDLTIWLKLAENAEWANFQALRQTFGSAYQVGRCVVFDVGNNRYRLIAVVSYPKGKVYVQAVMDHKEYDRRRWIDECHCR